MHKDDLDTSPINGPDRDEEAELEEVEEVAASAGEPELPVPVKSVLLPQLPMYAFPRSAVTSNWTGKPNALWRLLETHKEKHRHPWLRSQTDQWCQKTRELVQTAASGKDDDLFELLRRDPRYLADPYVVGKIASWKLTVRYSHKRFLPRDKAEEDRAKEAARPAKKKLKALASAIAAGTSAGKGGVSFISIVELHAEFDRLKDAAFLANRLIKAAAKPLSHTAKQDIADSAGLSIKEVEAVAASKYPTADAMADHLLAQRYGNMEKDRIRKLRSE